MSRTRRENGANGGSGGAPRTPRKRRRVNFIADDTDAEFAQLTHCDLVHVTTSSELPDIIVPDTLDDQQLDSNTDFLSHLLAPLPVRRMHEDGVGFFEEHFRRKPVAVQGAGEQRVRQLLATHMHGLDLRALMSESAGDNVFVWMKNTASASIPRVRPSTAELQAASPPITSFPLDNPTQLDAALACYAAGASLYFRSSPALSRLFVRALNAALGFGLWGLNADGSEKGEIEVFCSRAGHYTPFHTDFQDNFTVQLSGRKTWAFGPVSLEHPVRGWTPHYKDRSTEELQRKVHGIAVQGSRPWQGDAPKESSSVTLEAGDVLYHPAGVWHSVYCDEDSVSINVSLVATTYADVISDAVRQLLWTTPFGRAPISTRSATGSDDGLAGWRMRSAQGFVCAHLGAVDLLPSRLEPCVPPPPRRVVVSARDGIEQPPIRSFSVSPLWSVVPAVEMDEEVDDDSEESKDENVGEATVDYAFHYLFGNERLESAVRAVVAVPRAYGPLLERLVAMPRQWKRQDKVVLVSELTWAKSNELHQVLQALRQIGYITVAVIR